MLWTTDAIGSNDMARQKTAGVLVLASPTPLRGCCGSGSACQKARNRSAETQARMFGRWLRDDNGGVI